MKTVIKTLALLLLWVGTVLSLWAETPPIRDGKPSMGGVVTNSDGSKGVVFYVDPSGTWGSMVALEDASDGCSWGDIGDIYAMHNYTETYGQNVLNDRNGYANTVALLNHQGAGTGYAADAVDFANGWYLPSAAQLRKVYAALPFIEAALTAENGTLLTEDNYWSSTEFTHTDAWVPMFAMNHANKTQNHRVRAIRDFSVSGDFVVTAMPFDANEGSASGSNVYASGALATVTATPANGYLFQNWTEDGIVVSTNASYSFDVYTNRDLVAHFVPVRSIGTLITNSDGSQGVVFYTDPTGTWGSMVALEDASNGCAWGRTSDVFSLNNRLETYGQNVLDDRNGYANTIALRNAQGSGTGYAADAVDFANGWYLPSAAQLRKLYGALPFVEEALEAASGTLLTENAYWSSTEYSHTDAWNPMFTMTNANKTQSHYVRAIRDFSVNDFFTVTAAPFNANEGSVTGGGMLMVGTVATLTATPAAGFLFQRWTEDGIEVSTDATYSFDAYTNRDLVAHFVPERSIGTLITNSDNSKGVVFYVDPSGNGGCMVALEDASNGCPWGAATDVFAMKNRLETYSQNVLDNRNGYANTIALRNYQGHGSGYAADAVDFENGWYLPSAAQLRKLYAALPFIEAAITAENGTLLTEDNYWSSTEYSLTDAWDPMFTVANSSKMENRYVRAVRDFTADGTFAVTTRPNNNIAGSTSGDGIYQTGATVTVTAIPANGYVFQNWMEDDVEVSSDATYSFTAYSNRNLVAHFLREGTIGTVFTNADGSKGVVFYEDPSGTGGWMVALNDASNSCVWGNGIEDVDGLDNLDPEFVQNLLADVDGLRNNREMQNNYGEQWIMPTAAQLRKLYAALPLIENAILKAGGTILTDDAYWSSTEQSETNAWTPSFAFSSKAKNNNSPVRAIRYFRLSQLQDVPVFVGTDNNLWSDPNNWLNITNNPPGANDDAIVSTQCVVDDDASVKSLTMTYASAINVADGKVLAASQRLFNTGFNPVNLGTDAELVNPTEGAYFTMNKAITGYGTSEDGGWYTIATPLKDGMNITPWTTGEYDLYYYDEPTHYWINEEDPNNNFTALENGKGYLYANTADLTLHLVGQAKSSTVEYSSIVTNTASAGSLKGFNLMGNPFTSSVAINSVKVNGAALSAYYKVSNGNELMAYTDADNEPIHPTEGFFVQCQEGTLSFNTPSRGDAVNGYVRFVLHQADKMLDRAYLRTNKGEGMAKLRMDNPKVELYFYEDGNDFAVAWRQEDVMEYPLHFMTKRNGMFTLTADLLNVDCGYLHLIDNLTGANIDLLTTPSYNFTATPSDYAARFLLVFSSNNENENQSDFAFISNGNLIVAGTGTLQVFDALGHQLYTKQLTTANCQLPTANYSVGVYVLRLINDVGVRTQKIVIE